MKQFNYRIGNIEARVAHPGLSLEIVQWSGDHCWSIVSFQQQKDTGRWDAILLGDRAVDAHVDWKDLGKLIRYAYEFLNEV